jgi:uncharacterized protein
MDKQKKFVDYINQGYYSEKKTLTLGAATLDGNIEKAAQVKLSLSTLNRHGLIAGATGTGKTVTLQVLAENMCEAGIPVLLMDLKGDLSGIAIEGNENEKISLRHQQIGITYQPKKSTTEFYSLSKEQGARLRATVSEFGPVLFSKILEVNETQAGVIAVLFKFADDRKLPLLDLKDFKQLLQYTTNEGKEEFKKEYGNIPSASASTILRKIIELEGQGAELFFGEKSFDVNDLIRRDESGFGIASIIRLTDIQDKPKLFSTFMLCLLAEIYSTFPEAGDLEKPKLCIFIDEAHLVFKEASKALLEQIESIIKLIRSKGVGIYFITQNPYDVPEEVLSQLGLKIQHALRAFTEKDRKAIKKTAENYPSSEFYKTEELLTSIGIGQALVTGLNEKGIPTPLAAVHLRAPKSRIGILLPNELEECIKKSVLVAKYNTMIDRESAYEILTKKLEQRMGDDLQSTSKLNSTKTKHKKEEESVLEEALKNPMVKTVGRTLARELTRGLLGVLGFKYRK